MHRVTRAWNVPLGIALFGGAIFVGGAVLALIDARRAPTRTDVGNTESRPFPSWPGEVAPSSTETATPPVAVGGGPASATTSTETEPTQTAPSASASLAVPPPLPAPAAASASASARATTATSSAPATSAVPEPEPATSASAAASAAAGTLMTDAGTDGGIDAGPLAPVPSGSAYAPPPLAAPVFGAPPSTAPSGVPIVGNAAGNTTPIYSGSSGGSTNPGVVDAKPSITAPLMVPMSASTNPEAFWTSISAFLRGGDLVVANARDAGSPYVTWVDRVRTDTPLVGYAVAFDTPASLDTALPKLPAALDTVGLASLKGMDDKTFTALANKVHDAGKRFFVSISLPIGGPSLRTVGARSELVELVGVDTTTADAMFTSLRATGHPQVFVRVPSATPGQALDMANASNAILKKIPDAGIALPFNEQLGRVLSDLRATP